MLLVCGGDQNPKQLFLLHQPLAIHAAPSSVEAVVQAVRGCRSRAEASLLVAALCEPSQGLQPGTGVCDNVNNFGGGDAGTIVTALCAELVRRGMFADVTRVVTQGSVRPGPGSLAEVMKLLASVPTWDQLDTVPTDGATRKQWGPVAAATAVLKHACEHPEAAGKEHRESLRELCSDYVSCCATHGSHPLSTARVLPKAAQTGLTLPRKVYAYFEVQLQGRGTPQPAKARKAAAREGVQLVIRLAEAWALEYRLLLNVRRPVYTATTPAALLRATATVHAANKGVDATPAYDSIVAHVCDSGSVHHAAAVVNTATASHAPLSLQVRAA